MEFQRAEDSRYPPGEEPPLSETRQEANNTTTSYPVVPRPTESYFAPGLSYIATLTADSSAAAESIPPAPEPLTITSSEEERHVNKEAKRARVKAAGWEPAIEEALEALRGLTEGNEIVKPGIISRWATIENPALQQALIDVGVSDAYKAEVITTATNNFDSKATWAVDELIRNAVEHGNQGDPHRTVLISSGYSRSGTFSLWIQDEGEGYVPKDIPINTLDENITMPSGRGVQVTIGLIVDENWEELIQSQVPDKWPADITGERYGTVQIFDGGRGVAVRLGWEKFVSEAYREIRE